MCNSKIEPTHISLMVSKILFILFFFNLKPKVYSLYLVVRSLVKASFSLKGSHFFVVLFFRYKLFFFPHTLKL